ncbi:MAG: TonB-dependent receptor [Bacteroidetes bacterium]|nr:TonB-dependent receptor [Bacteroidota bacterium]MCW5896235.1 TonB-dependent receptor [Bacteroidota bacterium]
MRFRFTYLLAFLVFLVTEYSLAQTGGKGRIEGRVLDAKGTEGLPGANVVLKGTYHGGSSNIDGVVKIENVNPGSYTIEVTLLGYKVVQFTNIKVEAGQTARFTARMEETVLAMDKEVIVIGEKPLFDIEETASRRSVGQQDIQAAALTKVENIVALQPGVVFSDNEIHIRGGRTHEAALLLDGVSIQDPLAGTGFGLQVSPGSIQDVEVITGGYNAEYGQATSGIVSITTREGSEKYSGSVSYKLDHFGLNKNARSNWNTDNFDMSLSGPEPLTTYLLPALGIEIPGSMSFFGTVFAKRSDDYTRWVQIADGQGRPAGYVVQAPNGLYSSIFPSGGGSSFSPRRNNDYSMLAKFTYKPTGTVKLSYTFNQSVVINQNTQTIQATLDRVEPNPGYQYLFQFIPDSANTFTQRNIQHALSWTHTLSKEMFYDVRISRYTAHIRGDANGKDFSQYIEPQDIVTFPIRYYNQNTDTVGVIPGDGFYDIGAPSSYRDQYASEITLKFDLTNYFSERNKFKTGVELRFQELQMVDIFRPWIKPQGFDNDIYNVNPALGALYVQDNITLKGMILNVGLRLDYWLPGKYVDDIASDTSSSLIVSPGLRKQYLDNTFSLFGRRVKARMSPRLGISHPISDNQTLFFSYGHFSKFPRPQYVYSKLNRTSVRSNTAAVGNPDLNPETTVAYELGVRNQLSGNDVLTVTAYYKDIFDYITEKTVRRTSGLGGTQFYSTNLNADYARVKGIEAEYKKRIGNWFRGSLSGSYSIATGKSSSPNENSVRLQEGEPENIKERFLIWDRPVQVSANFNFTVAKDEPLFGFAPGILDDYNLFVRVFLQSGKRYTPQRLLGTNAITGRPEWITDIERINEGRGENWFTVDINFEKYFDLGFARLIAAIEVQNLLNNKNSQIINPVTGRAYEYGDPTPLSWNDPVYPQLTGNVSPYPYDPARYREPRTMRLSLALRF